MDEASDRDDKNVYIIRHIIAFDPPAMDLLNGILDAIAATDRVSPASQQLLDGIAKQYSDAAQSLSELALELGSINTNLPK